MKKNIHDSNLPLPEDLDELESSKLSEHGSVSDHGSPRFAAEDKQGPKKVNSFETFDELQRNGSMLTR